MKQGVKRSMFMGLVAMATAMFFCGSIHAQDLSDLMVAYGAVCENVVDHEVVSASTSFPSRVEKLYCFTKIVGAKEPTKITHVWYYGETERARVELAVKSASWRTHSSKLIQLGETGKWRVEVLDKDGRLLETYRFDIYR